VLVNSGAILSKNGFVLIVLIRVFGISFGESGHVVVEIAVYSLGSLGDGED